MSKKNTSLIVYLIVFIALLFRLIGIQHSFPFIFHPDEPTIVRSALDVRFKSNPGHFDWPHLYIYANYFVYMLFSRLRTFIMDSGFQDIAVRTVPLIFDNTLIWYFLTRCFTAILSALTVVPVYKTAKVLFGEKTAILSGLCLALLPFHMWHSHYSLPDAPMLFLMAWGVYFSAKALAEYRPIAFIWSGLFLGLAASTKYNGGLGVVVVPLAAFLMWMGYLLRLYGIKEGFGYFRVLLSGFGAGLASLLGFVAGTPYALLDFKTFKRTDGPAGAFWQFQNVGSVSPAEHLNKFINDIAFKISDDLGYIVIVALFVVLILVIVRFIRKTYSKYDVHLIYLLVPSIFLIWYISGFDRSRSQYYFVIYPFVSVIFGYFCVWVTNRADSYKKFLTLPLLFLLFFPLIYFSILNIYRFLENDTRLYLMKFLQSERVSVPVVVFNTVEVEDVAKFVYPNARKNSVGLPKGTKFLSITINNKNPEGKVVFDLSNKYKLGPSVTVEEKIK